VLGGSPAEVARRYGAFQPARRQDISPLNRLAEGGSKDGRFYRGRGRIAGPDTEVDDFGSERAAGPLNHLASAGTESLRSTPSAVGTSAEKRENLLAARRRGGSRNRLFSAAIVDREVNAGRAPAATTRVSFAAQFFDS